MADDADVVIAGAGPAGLATAIAARCRGLSVVLLDGARPPIDKACGEGLMPDGVEILRQLGVELRAAIARPFRGIRYLDGRLVAEGVFPGPGGLGIRRTELYRVLQERAEDSGVEICWGRRVVGLSDDGFETETGRIRGRWLVGADGRASRIRAWSGLGGRPARWRRFGVRRHYVIKPWTDLVEVHWGEDCEAYVTPVGEQLVGIAMLWSGDPATFDELLARFPVLMGHVAGAPVASRDRGAGPLRQRCRKVFSGRLALVGDASGYLDAITGEGLALAFRQALSLVDALVAGNLDGYASAHRRIGRYPGAMTRMLLVVERHPRLRSRVMESLAADSTLMSQFLALKMRRDGPQAFGSGGLVPLAAAVLRGRP